VLARVVRHVADPGPQPPSRHIPALGCEQKCHPGTDERPDQQSANESHDAARAIVIGKGFEFLLLVVESFLVIDEVQLFFACHGRSQVSRRCRPERVVRSLSSYSTWRGTGLLPLTPREASASQPTGHHVAPSPVSAGPVRQVRWAQHLLSPCLLGYY
jgi:hypothetical protein